MATRKSSTSKRPTPQPAVRPDEAISEVTAALRDTMRAIAGELRDEKLFPFGITKISVSLSLPAGIAATLDIEGPTTRSAPAGRSGGSDTMVAAPFAGRSIDSLNLAPHALAGAQSLSDPVRRGHRFHEWPKNCFRPMPRDGAEYRHHRQPALDRRYVQARSRTTSVGGRASRSNLSRRSANRTAVRHERMGRRKAKDDFISS